MLQAVVRLFVSVNSSINCLFFFLAVPSCVRQQQIANVVPGVFYPTCQKNGTFHPQQCHPISNKCFCVDRNGVSIKGTEMEISQGLPVCNPYWNGKHFRYDIHVVLTWLAYDAQMYPYDTNM